MDNNIEIERSSNSNFTEEVITLLKHSMNDLANRIADEILIHELKHLYSNQLYDDLAIKYMHFMDQLAKNIDQILASHHKSMIKEIETVWDDSEITGQ